MHIYFSGLGGVGIGPLAEIAQDAGYVVSGSDLQESPMTRALEERGISVRIGQDGSQIAAVQQSRPIDWFVYTAALTQDHPELKFAREHGIRTSKRDELLANIIKDKGLKLIAVSGTHGKTGTTGMLVWLLQQTGVSISYSVGATLSFAPSGKYSPDSKYFVYECDEYDRNFLHFDPWTSIITSVDYDHPNTYPTTDDYKKAFVEFMAKSQHAYIWQRDVTYLGEENLNAVVKAIDATKPKGFVVFNDDTDLSIVPLPGKHNRQNGYLAASLVADGLGFGEEINPEKRREIFDLLKDFPGTDRRFEKLADNLYADYGHHPAEIAATLQMASELNEHIVLVYQPHQNLRQHHIKDSYTDCMKLAEQIYWLPTYLSREDPSLKVLTPKELSANLTNKDSVVVSEMGDELWQSISRARSAGKFVLVMGAGDVDGWVREQLQPKQTSA
jgi:UDP-N-acetylmuramate--alanine ligase